jgi:membrane-bound lytic murein transglycosylase B
MIVRTLFACLCLIGPLSGFVIAKPAAPVQAQQGAGFPAWVEQTLWPAAKAKGINRAVFDQAMAGVTLDPAIIELTKKQSEFVKPVWSYLEGAVGSSRVAQGEARARDYASLLDRISEKTGVDPYIVLSIWGIETSFGSATGSKDIIRSLATLAYERYRGEFFRDELIEAMAILQQGHVGRSAMKGSWAGAMGHTQFMPSTFRQYAVDGNGDGKRDIWNDPVDALASTANYLKEKGWARDLPWGYEVTLPKNYDYRSRRGTFSQFARSGVKRIDGGALAGSAEASLFLPAGAEGPAFLITANYAAIKAYNASDAYALAVAHLADRIAGGPAIQGVWPKHDKPMGLNERMAIQKKLKALGYDVGEPDGRFGSKTREALIAFQEKNSLRPDGYPNAATVAKLLGR